MTKMVLALAVVFLFGAAPAFAQADPHAGHAMPAQPAAAPAQPAASNPALPPGANNAAEELKKSPRHGEYVDIKVPGATVPITTWVVYPERKEKAGVVIVIHEIFGLTDWIRGVADQLAEDGFIAVAPDLLSGKGPDGGGTAELGENATKVIRTVTPEEVTSALNAARDYATKLPAANGKSGTVGFCWGGSASFAYATNQPGLNAAVVYYGTSPQDAAAYARARAPVLGLYGGNDARVNATIPTAQDEMKKAGKTYEPHTFEGAGHGFLRQQDGQDGANMKATERAWPLTLAFLRQHLR
jgi:carboxymethylenebutenolidase